MHRLAKKCSQDVSSFYCNCLALSNNVGKTFSKLCNLSIILLQEGVINLSCSLLNHHHLSIYHRCGNPLLPACPTWDHKNENCRLRLETWTDLTYLGGEQLSLSRVIDYRLQPELSPAAAYSLLLIGQYLGKNVYWNNIWWCRCGGKAIRRLHIEISKEAHLVSLFSYPTVSLFVYDIHTSVYRWFAIFTWYYFV